MSMKRQKYKRINRWFLTSFICLFCSSSLTEVALASITEEYTSFTGRISEYIAEGQWNQALSLLKAQVKQEPANHAIRSRLMDLYLMLGMQNEAKILVEEVRFAYPGSIEPVLMEGELLLGGPLIARSDEAFQEEETLIRLKQLAREAADIDSLNPGVLYLRGMASRLESDYGKAEEYFLRALHYRPNEPKLQQALIELYLERGEWKFALPLISQAMEIDRKSVDTHYLVGQVFFEKGDPARSLHYLKQSEKLDCTERPKRLFLVAESQRRLSQSSEAAQSYQRLLTTYWPHRSDLWVRYAQLLDGLNDSDGAVLAYQKAYKLQPAILEPLLTQAESAFWSQSPVKAFPLYRRIYQIAPDREDILVLLVGLQYRLWQEGHYPSRIILNELQEWLRQRENENLTPSLRLADIQIQVIRGGLWTPGLQNIALEIVQSLAEPSYLQAEGYLLLNAPDKAQAVINQLDSPSNPRLMLQQFALAGAWPWTIRLVEQNSDSEPVKTWLQNWNELQLQKANEQLSSAMLYMKTNMPGEALAALEKARTYHPLSAELQIQFAALHLRQGRLEECDKALEIAENLGIPSIHTLQANELRKQLEIANLRELKKEKSSKSAKKR